MTPQSNLDVSGKLGTHPLAELLIEIGQAKLTGTVRLSREAKKTIIYFRGGKIVFAVSNIRESRLVFRLLKDGRIRQSDVRGCTDPASDIELTAWLQNKKILNSDDVRDAFVSQIKEIIVDALTWTDGEWIFSASARLRSDVSYDIDASSLLLGYSRCLTGATVMNRFASFSEKFVRQIESVEENPLQTHEACVLNVFQNAPLTFDDLRGILKMPDFALGQAIYTLWLGGFLIRLDWNRAFSESKIADIKIARMAKIKDAAPISAVTGPAAGIDEATAQSEIPAVEHPKISVEDWLSRTASAGTHYDTLGVSENARPEEIKNAYFELAKLFHPDRFHREEALHLRRIETAFAGLTQAYETLKSTESREAYNYKIRKELATKAKREAAGETTVDAGMHGDQALESFQHGMRLIGEQEYEAAMPYLGRAVHYNPQNALYHAYYAKALAGEGKQLHKAEAEFQAAVKLDPHNAKIRLMLAQFFIDRGLKKRAEGELSRFLDLAPDNNEARALLNGLQT